jgi:hypothetical protein
VTLGSLPKKILHFFTVGSHRLPADTVRPGEVSEMDLGRSGLNRYGYARLHFWLASDGAATDGTTELLWDYAETTESFCLSLLRSVKDA